MNIKPFAIGILTGIAVCPAYADGLIAKPADGQQTQEQLMSANVAHKEKENPAEMLTGMGAGGEIHSATIDQEGRWQTPGTSGSDTRSNK